MCAAGPEQDRVSIRLRLNDACRAEHSAGARAVFHDDGLSQAFAELGCNDACNHINPSPGREWNDQFNGLFGIILCGNWR
jgi:hypothetical protein